MLQKKLAIEAESREEKKAAQYVLNWGTIRSDVKLASSAMLSVGRSHLHLTDSEFDLEMTGMKTHLPVEQHLPFLCSYTITIDWSWPTWTEYRKVAYLYTRCCACQSLTWITKRKTKKNLKQFTLNSFILSRFFPFHTKSSTLAGLAQLVWG